MNVGETKTRLFKNASHTLTRVEGGYTIDGAPTVYGSVSGAALAITGSAVNGYSFWGLPSDGTGARGGTGVRTPRAAALMTDTEITAAIAAHEDAIKALRARMGERAAADKIALAAAVALIESAGGTVAVKAAAPKPVAIKKPARKAA